MTTDHTNVAEATETEAAMSATTTFTPGTVRWLSANGHPGYSAETARRVARLLDTYPGLSFHCAVYGGRELQLAIEAQREV